LKHHLAEADRQREAWEKPGSNALKRATKGVIRAAVVRKNPEWLKPLNIQDLELSRIIFCSRFRQQQHQSGGLPLADSRVIYNGVDLKVFAGVPRRPSGGSLRVLFAGRLVEEKGPHTAIEAIAELVSRGATGVKLSIAGVPSYPFEYSDRLRELVDSKGLAKNVNFLGEIPNSQISEIYRQHDVFVFPSIGEEGFPVSILEAMSCGLAVVGTTTGGTSEILQDMINSLTFVPGDASQLADRLEEMHRNPELTCLIATAGQALVREKFDIENITDQTIEYLESVAGNDGA